MNVVLISTYDLGRQPFGLASPAAWLAEQGHSVTTLDLALSPLPALVVRQAGVIAFYLPMHTATRLAVDAIRKVRLLNPGARLLAYGLYAPVNAEYLKDLGVEAVFGGEFEAALTSTVDRIANGDQARSQLVNLDRLNFKTPLRTSLPDLSRYSKLHVPGGSTIVGYTEASRGCKHVCRHCPVVPVYDGVFRVVPVEIVLSDVRQQVHAGARHITFGDPDFLNGPGHAMKIVREMQREFPAITYDATIKVEHLLRHSNLLPELRDTGCLFVTSAVEAVDDRVLEILDKGHSRADFLDVVPAMRDVGITLCPTFVPFNPWIDRSGYLDLLNTIRGLDLVDHVAPVQLALRLLIPPGSRLLDHPEMLPHVTQFDKPALLHRWRHPDPGMDELAARILRLVSSARKQHLSRRDIFMAIWTAASGETLPDDPCLPSRAAIPYMDEPWYC